MGGKENRAGKEWENLAERSFWGLRRNVETDKESEMTLEGGKKREGRCRGMILADSLSGAETQSRCITFPLVYFFLVSSQASSATGYAALFLSSRHGTRVSRLLLPSGRADNCCQDHSERDANFSNPLTPYKGSFFFFLEIVLPISCEIGGCLK